MAENDLKVISLVADESAAVETLPTTTVTTGDIVNAIPKFEEWVIGKLFVEFGVKDGLLIYHLYHTDRKAIFDVAISKMNETRSAEGRQSITEVANAALEEVPWWTNIQPCIVGAIAEHFRDAPASVKYVPEVDSWSVLMNMEAMSLGVQTPEHIAGFVFNVAHRLGQVVKAKKSSRVKVGRQSRPEFDELGPPQTPVLESRSHTRLFLISVSVASGSLREMV